MRRASGSDEQITKRQNERVGRRGGGKRSCNLVVPLSLSLLSLFFLLLFHIILFVFLLKVYPAAQRTRNAPVVESAPLRRHLPRRVHRPRTVAATAQPAGTITAADARAATTIANGHGSEVDGARQQRGEEGTLRERGSVVAW